MTEPIRDTKQIIVVRRDLPMPIGKIGAQVAHASMMFLSKVFREGRRIEDLDEPTRHWLCNAFTKVVVGVDSLAEMLTVKNEAELAGIPTQIVIDAGRTVFDGERTPTCISIGPWWCDEIDKVTRKLRLLNTMLSEESNRPRIEPVFVQISGRIRAYFGPTRCGKTSTMISRAIHDVKAGRDVCIISLDIGTKALLAKIDRILTKEFYVSRDPIERAAWWDQLPGRCRGVFGYSQGSMTIADLESSIRNFGKIDVLFLDGLDYASQDPNLSFNENMLRNSEAFLNLCVKLGVEGVYTRHLKPVDHVNVGILVSSQ